MRFPWQKRDEVLEEYAAPRQRRSRQTLRQAADRVLIKELKRTSDVELAQKIAGVSRPSSPSLIDQLKELKAVENVLKSFTGESGADGGMLRQITQGIGSGLAQALGPMIEGMVERMGKRQLTTTNPKRISTPEPTPIDTPATPETQPEPEGKPHLGDLAAYLDMEPEVAFEILENAYPDWIPVLASKTCDELIHEAETLATQNVDLVPIVARLSSTAGREWLGKLQELAKAALNASETE